MCRISVGTTLVFGPKVDMFDIFVFFSKNDLLRKKIAKKGKDKYFKLFDGNKIAKHIVDISLGNKSNLF